MDFEHTTTFVRQRAQILLDPYDPDAAVEDWSTPDEVEVEGYFDSVSSVEQSGRSQGSPVREQASTLKRLVIDDPDADIERGDRIRLGLKVWTVEGFPDTDKNPFTGWQPTLVANVREWVG